MMPPSLPGTSTISRVAKLNGCRSFRHSPSFPDGAIANTYREVFHRVDLHNPSGPYSHYAYNDFGFSCTAYLELAIGRTHPL